MASSPEIELNIKRFEPTILEHYRRHGRPPKILVLGKSGSGKTSLVQDLLFYIRKIHAGVVVCPTEASLVDYRVMFPEIFIHDRWDSEVIADFLKMQKKIRKTNPRFHQLLMLDDIMYDNKTILKDESTRFIFMNGRNNNISVIVTMQYCMDITPDIRNQIDFVFALRDNVHANREKLWKNFFGIIPTSDAFHQIMSRCTTGYNAIVLDNNARSGKIEDCIFYYCADSKFETAQVARAFPNSKCDLLFEDGMQVEGVDRAFIRRPNDEDPSFDELPVRSGEVVEAKYKRTWLTLPPEKRRCFHKDMWRYHQQRFNPYYDDDVPHPGPVAAAAAAAGARTATTASAGAGGAAAAAAGNGGSRDFQEQFRKTKRGERPNLKVKMI
jgi:hypothetical protein